MDKDIALKRAPKALTIQSDRVTEIGKMLEAFAALRKVTQHE
jgi:hypothetical protein